MQKKGYHFRGRCVEVNYTGIIPLTKILDTFETMGKCSYSITHPSPTLQSTIALIYWRIQVKKNDPLAHFSISDGESKTVPSSFKEIKGTDGIKDSLTKQFIAAAKAHAQPWSGRAGMAAEAAWPMVDHLLQSEDLPAVTVTVSRLERLKFIGQEAAKGPLQREVAINGDVMKSNEKIPRSVANDLARDRQKADESEAMLETMLVRQHVYERASFVSAAAVQLFNFDHAKRKGHPYLTGPVGMGKFTAAVHSLIDRDPDHRPVVVVNNLQGLQFADCYQKCLAGKKRISGIILRNFQFGGAGLNDALCVCYGGFQDGPCTLPMAGRDRSKLVLHSVTIDPGTPIIFINDSVSLFDEEVMKKPGIVAKLHKIDFDGPVNEASQGPAA